MTDHQDENALTVADLGIDEHGGLRVCSLGEDGDLLVLGHHDPAALWAAVGAYQVTFGSWLVPDEEPIEDYLVKQGYAHFSRHSQGCDDQAKAPCGPCKSGDHAACTQQVCLCEEDFDHDPDEGPTATWGDDDCGCDEYAWWAAETKTGEPVTWVSYDWQAAHERRLLPGSDRS